MDGLETMQAGLGDENATDGASDGAVETIVCHNDANPHVALGRDLRRSMGILLPKELASMLDCKETTLMNWRMERTGPDYIKISKMIYYRIVDVQDWMAANVRVVTRTMDA